MSRALVVFAFGLVAMRLARAEVPRPRYTASRTMAPPTIDGRLDDPAWRGAPVDNRFTQNFPNEAQRPSQRTELRVLYDDAALYIAVRCWDDHPLGIIERLTRRDGSTDADRITVDISSKDDRSTAYHFEINVSGVLTDGVRFNDTDSSNDWDGLWLGATHRDAGGWSAELRIPLQTLRYEGGREAFGFQVRRYLARRQEIDEWAYVPRAARGEVSYYGTLDGLRGLHATRLFQIVPYLAAGVSLRNRQAPPALDGTRLYGNLGADLKLGLTPALTLDATINPDFGQVEADQVVLNLSTFEVFFPEKRPFFLEGIDIFSSPLSLFYSRRIGRSAPPPNSDHYTALEPSVPGRIYAAAKVSGLVAPRLTIGLIDAVAASASTVADQAASPGSRIEIATAPLTNYGVLRLKRDILARSSVGFMATATTRFESPGQLLPQAGEDCPDGAPASHHGRCTRDAYTSGIDFNLRTANGNWGAMGQVAGSVLANGPTRTIADGTVVGPGTGGLGLALDGGKYNGNFWAYLTYRGYSPGFDNNDLGYTEQSNLHRFRPHLHWRFLTPHSIFLEGDINLSAMLRFSWDFRTVLQQEYWLGADLYFRNFWKLYIEVDYDTDHWDLREARDGAAVQRTGFWSVFYEFKTDPRRRLWVSGNGYTHRVRHGRALDAWFQIALRPLPALQLDLLPHVNWTYGDPRWFDTEPLPDGSKLYYFGDLDSRNFDVTLRGTYTFTPNLTLQAYAQLFLAGGHYGATSAAVARGVGSQITLAALQPTARPSASQPDFRDGAINVNLVLRWEFQPGSTLLLVYTHAQQQTAFDPVRGSGSPSLEAFAGGAATDQFLLKLSLLLS